MSRISNERYKGGCEHDAKSRIKAWLKWKEVCSTMIRSVLIIISNWGQGTVCSDKERARVTGGDRNYNAAPAAAASTWSLGERSETEWGHQQWHKLGTKYERSDGDGTGESIPPSDLQGTRLWMAVGSVVHSASLERVTSSRPSSEQTAHHRWTWRRTAVSV